MAIDGLPGHVRRMTLRHLLRAGVYVPRVLAGWGIFASLVPIIIPFSTIVFSTLADAPLRRARSGIPIAIFEAAIGLWLLIKGLKQPAIE